MIQIGTIWHLCFDQAYNCIPGIDIIMVMHACKNHQGGLILLIIRNISQHSFTRNVVTLIFQIKEYQDEKWRQIPGDFFIIIKCEITLYDEDPDLCKCKKRIRTHQNCVGRLYPHPHTRDTRVYFHTVSAFTSVLAMNKTSAQAPASAITF